MRKSHLLTVCICVAISTILLLALAPDSHARRPIRNDFFAVYPSAEGSRLDDVPSNPSHCGACHFDFDGGGPRNPYGLAVEVARNSGMYATDQEAIQAIENEDSDNDGYTNLIEITDTAHFTNTPTFPGLNQNNISSVSNVSLLEINGHLTPSGSLDTTPPEVTVVSPNGGESFNAETVGNISWSATDASGISHVNIYLSDDGGATYKPIAKSLRSDIPFGWFVLNLPGTQNRVRVVARDNAGNYGFDDSDAAFTIVATPGGKVPTTLRDMELSGTQPFEGGILDNPDVSCTTCHAGYDTNVEPWHQWKGSMMAQAARDPLFFACLAVSEQDAPSVGDLCLRCHTPGGWQEGRSGDTGGGMLTAKDRQGVQCDFCHRAVDPDYKLGISPLEDVAVLDSLDVIPPAYANGQFVTDPNPIRRGPFFDAEASHAFLESPFHRKADMCGTCHDVSNPVYVQGATPDIYVPNTFDSPHPDEDLRNMFPVERTFSEWSMSEYASTGVYAPQFAGNKADGIVSTCQDCHMADVSGKGCNEPGAPTRPDLPLHDLTGGNYFIPDILPGFFPGEVDSLRLRDGKLRAISMLQKAAGMSLSTGQYGGNPAVFVAITNETGHKLPSGYPEGRRIWINLKAYDDGSALVYESGAYDFATGILTHDADAKIYEIKPGVSSRLSPIVGLDVGPSFHFVLNDSIFSDNRIPPRGFTNANFVAIQSPPVAYSYADGQYSDTTMYVLPLEAAFVEATLYYQSTTKGYVEFLRDENVTNTAGQEIYDAWVAQGRAAPVAMVSDTISVEPLIDVPIGGTPRFRDALFQNVPNPFNPLTQISYSLKTAGHVTIRIYDVGGALVRTLVDGRMPEGVHEAVWDGRSDNGAVVSSGVYVVKMETGKYRATRKAVLLK
ncbi:MAG: T9SS type A sorting domain-containing protein [Candidatus Eiseniibacteriota bacterium]|nr:MAG: T9SS type A sorting domain-containing protein [Candidatus Eisenbacteria bacterium]